MKRRSSKNQEKGNTNILAQEIFSVVRRLPPKLELKVVSDVFERILSKPEKSNLWKIESLREYWTQKPIESAGEHLSSHSQTLLLHLLTIAAIDAFEECCQDLPSEATALLELIPLESGRVHQLLESIGRFQGSFQDFQKYGQKNEEWLEAATQYAVVLDACERYTTFRSWYDRLYRLAFISLPIIRDSADEFAKLFPVNRVFGISQLAVADGRISFEPDKFTAAFLNVEIDRIRICGACNKVFWATRTDMKGCTVPCAKVIRTRKWRANAENRLKEKYRDYKRDSKEKNNGTI